MIRNLDIYCSKGYRASNNTAFKLQTQKTPAKDSSRPEKPKTKDPKSAPSHTNMVEPSEQDKKDKKDQKDTKQKFWDKKHKVIPRPVAIMLSSLQKTRKRTEIVILVKSYIIIIIKRSTLQILALS